MYIYIRTCIYMPYVHMYIYTYISYTSTKIYAYEHMGMCTHTNVYIYAYIHTVTSARTHTYLHIHTGIYMHIHMYLYICVSYTCMYLHFVKYTCTSPMCACVCGLALVCVFVLMSIIHWPIPCGKYFPNKREVPLEFNRTFVSSNSFLQERTNCRLVSKYVSRRGKYAAVAQPWLRQVNHKYLEKNSSREFWFSSKFQSMEKCQIQVRARLHLFEVQCLCTLAAVDFCCGNQRFLSEIAIVH